LSRNMALSARFASFVAVRGHGLASGRGASSVSG
jgi:hypothetical protein